MVSSSSLSHDHEKYDVFISLSVDDTANHFACHLYSALRDKQIKAAFYNEQSSENSGDEMSPALYKAVQEAKLSVIIFSENYAYSPRCLEELNQIMQPKERNEQRVLPIFYNVNPSHIRKQEESFGNAIAAHEKSLKDSNPDLVKQWRVALTKAANLSGWDSSVARSEFELVDDVVKVIMSNLYATSPPSKGTKGLIGADNRIKKIESLLCMESSDNDVCIVGVCGVEGIGKTSLARVLFDKLSPQFEATIFLENVKDETENRRLKHLENKLFSTLLKEEDLSSINWTVMERLKSSKVLIVLDDVDDFEQFQRLAGDRDWFCPGSKIIVTTRDEQVLNNIEVDGKYTVEELNCDEALELFDLIAFKGEVSTSEFAEISKIMIGHAKGIPKALIDLGRRLRSRSIQVWRSELSRMAN